MLIEHMERTLRAPFEVPARRLNAPIVLASYPKSGNTWVRFIAANLKLCYSPELSERVDFHSIERLSPEIRGNRRLVDVLESSRFPTFLKTHFYYVAGFRTFKKVVLFRGPEKTLASYHAYLSNEHGRTYRSFDAFVRAARVGADSWRLFHRSWLESDAIFVNYDDLRGNPVVGMGVLLSTLGINVELSILERSINNSSRREMGRLEELYGDPNKKNSKFRFVSAANRKHEGEKCALSLNSEVLMERCRLVFAELQSAKLEI